jgi:hypothetical protein
MFSQRRSKFIVNEKTTRSSVFLFQTQMRTKKNLDFFGEKGSENYLELP